MPKAKVHETSVWNSDEQQPAWPAQGEGGRKDLSSLPVPGQEFPRVSHLGIFHNYKFSSQISERRAQFQGTVSRSQRTPPAPPRGACAGRAWQVHSGSGGGPAGPAGGDAPRGPPRGASGPREGKKFFLPSPRLRYRQGLKNSTSHGSERRPRLSETGLVPRRSSSTAALVAPLGTAASQSELQHTARESDTPLRARDGQMPHPHATKLPLGQVRSAGPKATPGRKA
ncbi:uncharacterized protein LOC115912236 [Camarhynchus parvulus]|uniref:uncharacterized protein LOC115912236 n=1 Tax=Geospiza parvula TaxID=87175 RepID=UPI00123818DA|nr:uncharacterized protein LOC115912236 [Camarhynchus parvulus]